MLVVHERLEEEVVELSKTMNTTPTDVVSTGIELLKLALSREVVLRHPGNKEELIISLFEKIKPNIDLNTDQNVR